MASNKLIEPSKKKMNLLKPDQIPEVTLDSDSQEPERNNNKTVDNDEDYGQLGPHQPLLQQEIALLKSGYTECSRVQITTEAPQSPSPPDVPKEEDKQNEPDQQTLQQ
jgi:hypothetical protein